MTGDSDQEPSSTETDVQSEDSVREENFNSSFYQFLEELNLTRDEKGSTREGQEQEPQGYYVL